jgi:Rho GTPase-activating protein 1
VRPALPSIGYVLKNYRENLNHEREIVVPKDQQAAHRMFGVALEELMGPDGEFSAVPPVIRDCVAYLRSTGLNKQGLFRRSPSTAILRQLEEAYDRGQRVDIANYDDPHLAAVLIKKFFRMLPQSIFSEGMYSVIRKCPVPDDEGTKAASIEYVREEVIGGLPGNAQVLLNIVIRMWTSFDHTAPRIHLTASRTPPRSLKKFSQEPHGRPQSCCGLYPQPCIQRQPSP